MNPKLKIILIVLTAILISLGIYLLASRPTEPTPPKLGGLGISEEQAADEAVGAGGAPAPAESVSKKIERLGNLTLLDFWIDKQNSAFYYLNESGQVFQISGNPENPELENNLNSQTLTNFHRLIPAPDGSGAIAEFNYPQAPIFSVFDVGSKNWQPLPAGTIAADWSPDSQEIVYLNDKGLKIWNRGTKKTRDIIPLSQKDLDLKWLNKDQILLLDKASRDFTGSIWSLNVSRKTLTPTLQNKNGLMTQWSLAGNRGIAFHNSGLNPVTTLIDNNGVALRTFSFVTMPSKCALDAEKIYCAIPKNIPERAILPDDYLKREIYFEDGVYLIDLTAETITTLFEKDQPIIDAEHLEVYQNKIYFKNRLDNGLYTVNLE